MREGRRFEARRDALGFSVAARSRLGLWLTACLAAIIVGWVVLSLASNPAFDWAAVGQYLFHPQVMRGLGITLWLTVVSLTIAILLGAVIAIIAISPNRLLRAMATLYVWLFRGVPALIQLIFWFNLALLVREVSLTLPLVGTVFAIETNDLISPFTAAIIALSLCEAGYMAEILRAGITSVPSGQLEAARSLGMGYRSTLWRIVLPQAMRVVIPPTGNEAISLLKMTSLVTYVAVEDLFYAAQSIYARTFETIPLLIVVALWYLAVVSILSIGQSALERHFGRSDAALSPGMGHRLWRVSVPNRQGA